MLSTPGPGSVLFQNTTPWLVRMGGGMGAGAALGVLCFASSTHPLCAPYVRYLPVTMQPAPLPDASSEA